MKIDFIVGSLSGGGAERVLVLLANELNRKRNTISIITFGGIDSYTHDKDINRVRLHQGNIKNHTIRRFFQLRKYYSDKKNRPDIIISFIPSVNFVTILIAKIYNIKIIVSEHINHLQIGSIRDQFTRKYLYRFADITTVLTKFDVKYYQKHKANVMVMPNPCTFDILKDNDCSRENSIIAVGSLDRYHHKGFDNLIEIVAPILMKHPSWHLKIVGGGDKGMKFLLDLTVKNKIQNRIHFLGFRDDIKDIMKSSEIFILPSRYEGLPMVLLEAMSQGMTCIAYDCKTGPSDMIENEKNGLLIEDQNIEAMQNGLESLINDKEQREKLSNHAVQSLENFSIKTIISKWEELFTKIM